MTSSDPTPTASRSTPCWIFHATCRQRRLGLNTGSGRICSSSPSQQVTHKLYRVDVVMTGEDCSVSKRRNGQREIVDAKVHVTLFEDDKSKYLIIL